jgi:hypothetical protein
LHGRPRQCRWLTEAPHQTADQLGRTLPGQLKTGRADLVAPDAEHKHAIRRVPIHPKPPTAVTSIGKHNSSSGKDSHHSHSEIITLKRQDRYNELEQLPTVTYCGLIA